MKRKYMLCVAGLSVFLVSGCSEKESQMSYLGIEEVKQMALKEAGFSASEVEFTETSLERRNGIDYYEVDFKAAGEEYEYDIDALTGVIIAADVLLTDTKSIADTQISESTENTGSIEQTDNAAYDRKAENAENYAPSTSGTMITAEKAKELTLAQVPGAAAKDIAEFEVDYDDGHTEYEGKIVYGGMEYEFEIDAYSGTFWSWETEPVDD